MSELINTRTSRIARWQLLATVSALSLLTSAEVPAGANESSRPTVWIELGGQLERMDSSLSPFPLPFLSPRPEFVTFNTAAVQRPAHFSHGFEGKVTFAPEGSDWLFSAAVRFGRSNGKRTAHSSQSIPMPSVCFGSFCHSNPGYVGKRFANVDAQNKSSHTILDFEVGKDVGLGLFGSAGQSHIGAGVRFAQFASSSRANMHARPDFHWDGVIPNYPSVYIPRSVFHNYTFAGQRTADFRGIGPSLSWGGRAQIAPVSDGVAVDFDWGLNGALLFGRQKVRGTQSKTTSYINLQHYTYSTSTSVRGIPRSRSVIVPNVGGFAGLSLTFPSAKVSLGYRADFFFGAMDSGVDGRRAQSVGFHGPFATISIGLGG